MADIVKTITEHRETQNLLKAHGLTATKVTWEDTGRSKGSCWGPNISDMTLVLQDKTLMPIVRTPNFADVTQDIPIGVFKVNYEGKDMPLEDLLKTLNVWDDRDSVLLTSSQCCILPVKPGQKTEFSVQLFNYQSHSKDPAVLTILVSKLGTSVQVLSDSDVKLFFNDNGTSRWFSVERLEDVRIRNNVAKTRVDSFKEMTDAEKLDNTLMVIQVPLKQKERPQRFKCGTTFNSNYEEGFMLFGAAKTELQSLSLDGAESYSDGLMDCEQEESMLQCMCAMPMSYRGVEPQQEKKVGHGMDMGQLSLGSEAGQYTGTEGFTLTRDARFPIRVTFQYYRGTDENFITEKNILDIKAQLEQSVQLATAQGTLVLNPNSGRVTEHTA